MPKGIPNTPRKPIVSLDEAIDEIHEMTEDRGEVMDRDPRKLGIERQSKEGRAPRVPMSAGGKLAVPESMKEEGYQYYWALDRPGELQKFKAAWWEHVTDERKNPITTPAGGGDTHYLMRLPKDLYDKDIAAQQERVNDAMVESARVKESEYVPKDREGVLTRDVLV